MANAKRLATLFSRALWERGWDCGTNWPIEVVKIATLYESDENDRFFTTSLDPYTSRLFYTIHYKKPERMAFKKNA
jgi:hypothetical protein